jgi:hypothetical protein
VSFYWIYDIPNWLLGLLTVPIFSGIAAAGLLATRRPVRWLVGRPPGANEVVSYYLGAGGVFYGITLGLIAVASWQNFDDLDRLVAQEAAALRVLDHSAAWYPPPVRAELRAGLLDYAGFVIQEEWPAQQRGIALETGQARLDAFEDPLRAFEPATAGQQAVHEETLRAYAHYLELRRQRLYSVVNTGLPAVVWCVLLAGAVLNVGLTYLFSLHRLRGHLVLTVVLASFIGLLIFLIAAMDHPYRGEFSVEPDSFTAVREQMLEPRAGPAPRPSGRPSRRRVRGRTSASSGCSR